VLRPAVLRPAVLRPAVLLPGRCPQAAMLVHRWSARPCPAPPDCDDESVIAAPVPPPAASRRGRRTSSSDAFCLILLAAVLVRLLLPSLLARPALQAWTTVFIAVCVQAAPFVVLGVAVSSAIAVYLPPSFFARVVPRRQSIAVPLAGLAGCLLPGCECGSVPVAAGLSRRGVPPGPSLAFLLAAPAVNPVVLVATGFAFPGHPIVVLARLIASMATAWVVGWCWAASGRELPGRDCRHEPAAAGRCRVGTVVATASHDLAQTLGLLVLGAASAATLKAVLPQTWLGQVAGGSVGSVLALAALAVVLAVCSESDAFIAASLTQFSLTARLVFMVVGPAVDVKLVILQAGTFGRAFAVRFAPLCWLAAVLCASLVATVLL
jgi:uncharacterized membrane protein YraQ (UPF0718 family)